MVTVPARLLELSNVSVRYQDADVCILDKQLPETQHARESYTSMHVLSVVREGEQHIAIADGPSVVVRAGQAVLLQRGLYTVTDLVTQQGGSFRAQLLYFSGRGVSPESGGGRAARRAFSFPGEMPPSRGPALDLLAGLPGIAEVLAAPRRSDPVDFLALHYDKPLTLDDLAYLTGMSVSTFQRQFRQQTGQSPRSWIIARRMQRAQHLLRQRQAVASVATQVGYRNVSHFISTYRRTYGHTPLTEYRHFAGATSAPL